MQLCLMRNRITGRFHLIVTNSCHHIKQKKARLFIDGRRDLRKKKTRLEKWKWKWIFFFFNLWIVVWRSTIFILTNVPENIWQAPHFFSRFLRILNLFSLKNGLRVEVTLTITGHYQVLSPLEEMVRKWNCPWKFPQSQR